LKESGVSLIEAAVRGGAFFLLVLGGLLLLRDARRVPGGLFAALFALGVASYSIVSASFVAGQPSVFLLPLLIAAIGNPVVFCLFAAAVFDDEFKPSWWHALAWLAVVAFGLFSLWSRFPGAHLVCGAIGLACNAIGVWYVLAGRSLDLVEERRRLRAALVVLVALYSAVTIVGEILLSETAVPLLSLANGIGLLAITMLFAFVLLSVSRDGALISFRPAVPQALAAVPRQLVVARDFDEPSGPGEDARLLTALRRLMDHDRVYREEGLSIGSLAAKLDTTEHSLRRLINQRLGYRNFNVFLNGYRLDEVMSALADPAQEMVPILTIALDAGFQSLGPFNRAFKSKTGMTPSEFRRERLGRNSRMAAE
jgi:AraC-like DNA-binding protein